MAYNIRKGRLALPFVLVGAAVVLMGISLGVACGGGGDEKGNGGTVGFAGGTVSLEGGPAVEIQAGAIAADSGAISVTIGKSTQKPSLPEGLKTVGDVWEIGPAGTTFAAPVRTTLPIPEGEDPADVMGVVTLDPESGEWVGVSSVVDTASRTVSAFTTHLSPFGIVGGRAEAAKTGGWIRVENPYVSGTAPFPGGKGLKMSVENLVCFTAYNPTIRPLLVKPSWDIVDAVSNWGWTVGTPPTVVEWWLPAGTYTLEESIFASEINNDPLYLPQYAWWTRPPQTITMTPGAVFVYKQFEVPPPSQSSGFVKRPNACALRWSPLAKGLVTPTATASSVVEPTGTASGNEEEFFNVSSTSGAYNGATQPTTFTIDNSWLVTEIVTYHWNDGQGKTPGTVGLRASDGTTYGPWQASGRPGSGDVADAYWVVNPNIVIPPGTYTVLDSDPGTWAWDEETGGVGMSWGKGTRQ